MLLHQDATLMAMLEVCRLMAVLYPEMYEGVDVEATLNVSGEQGARLICTNFTRRFDDGKERLVGLYRLHKAIQRKHQEATA